MCKLGHDNEIFSLQSPALLCLSGNAEQECSDPVAKAQNTCLVVRSGAHLKWAQGL